MRYKRLFEERYEGKVRGKWFRMKCPFHNENDASLDVDLEKSGFHCFAQGTPVMTNQGIKAIEEIVIGDKVFDCEGKYQSVEQTHVMKSKDLYSLKIKGIKTPVLVTGNHELLVQKINKCTRKGRTSRYCNNRCIVAKDKRYSCSMRLYEKYKDEWISVKDLALLKKDEFAIKALKPMLNARNPNIGNYQLAFVLGYYAAEGWYTKRSVCFVAHKKELDFVRNVLDPYMRGLFGIDRARLIKRKRKTNGIEFYYSFAQSKEFLDWFKMVGKGAQNKILPWDFLSSVELLKRFIDGYFFGDGTKSRGQKSITTVSRSLAYSLQVALLVIGYIAFIQEFRGAYIITWNEFPVRLESGYYYLDNFYRYATIEKINIKEEVDVYDLTVSGSHTYNVSNVIVHNCWGCNKTGNHTELIMRLERVSESAATNIISRYVSQGSPMSGILGAVNKISKPSYLDAAIIEKFIPIAQKKYIDYLKMRGIDRKVAKKYDLRQGNAIEKGWDNRIIYPIRDLDGNLCSVEGRSILDTSHLRYRKWSGSKSSLGLFGIDKIRKVDYGRPLIIVEGMFDCLSLVQVGYPCIAMVCSEISGKQLAQIKRITPHPIILLDGIKVGTEKPRREVRKRLHKAFSKKFSIFEIIVIPYRGKDPNDLYVEGGLKKFMRSVM